MRDPRKIAFEIFDNMKERETLRISVFAPNKPDLFIRYGKEYIDEGGELEFSNDYAYIRKISPIPPEIII